MNEIFSIGPPKTKFELIARISVRLKRSTQKTLQYINGDITLDITACSAYKNSKDLSLNAKEFLILKLFMENPERVFTKKQIYSAVWDDDYMYDDNTIMVHISRVRNKIEHDPQNPLYIKTIKGIGYKMCKVKKNEA